MGSLVSSVGSLLGASPNNANFQAQGVNPAQLQQAAALSTGAIDQQQQLATALGAQGQQGMGSQLQLGQALQQQAQGLGPNPAAAQMANATGQNIAAQSALMAGQRGANANVGLLARQAGQQGAGIQQQAVGQEAVLRAQQQLAAQSQLQNLAASQIGQQAGAVGNLNQFALGNQGQLLGSQANQNSTNAAMAQTNANNTAHLIGGLGNAAGAAFAGPLGSMLGGGGSALSGGSPAYESMGNSSATSPYGGLGGNYKFAEGGEVPEHLQKMHSIYHGGHYEHKESPKLSEVPMSDRFKQGGMVPGEPKVNRDDPKNDVVSAKLTPGEVVIDLDTLNSKGKIGDAARLVAEALKSKTGGDKKSEEGEFKKALKEAIKSRKK